MRASTTGAIEGEKGGKLPSSGAGAVGAGGCGRDSRKKSALGPSGFGAMAAPSKFADSTEVTTGAGGTGSCF